MFIGVTRCLLGAFVIYSLRLLHEKTSRADRRRESNESMSEALWTWEKLLDLNIILIQQILAVPVELDLL